MQLLLTRFALLLIATVAQAGWIIEQQITQTQNNNTNSGRMTTYLEGSSFRRDIEMKTSTQIARFFYSPKNRKLYSCLGSRKQGSCQEFEAGELFTGGFLALAQSGMALKFTVFHFEQDGRQNSLGSIACIPASGREVAKASGTAGSMLLQSHVKGCYANLPEMTQGIASIAQQEGALARAFADPKVYQDFKHYVGLGLPLEETTETRISSPMMKGKSVSTQRFLSAKKQSNPPSVFELPYGYTVVSAPRRIASQSVSSVPKGTPGNRTEEQIRQRVLKKTPAFRK